MRSLSGFLVFTYLAFYSSLAAAEPSASEGDTHESPTHASEAGVDLSDRRLPAPSAGNSVMSRPWYQNVKLTGFGAAGYLDSGDDGTRPNGGFLIKEASLFLDLDVWDEASVFVEVQTNRLAKDASLFVRTGEVYIHAPNVLSSWRQDLLGIKVGRFDIPFGEEYLYQDAIDNPLISTSAAYPYGFDEGILFHGIAREVGWIVSIADGTDERSAEDHADKAINGKLYGSLGPGVYLSSSIMKNGKAQKSAFEFGGSHFQPVGASHASQVGESPSQMVDAILYQVDGRFEFGDRVILSTFAGQAHVDDKENEFDRRLRWFSLEPRVDLSQSMYAIVRFSEIGTYDNLEGYHFDGKSTGGGNGAYGYDTKLLRRVSAGFGWQVNPRLVAKLEVGWDDFHLIEGSKLDPGNDDRVLTGFELVARF